MTFWQAVLLFLLAGFFLSAGLFWVAARLMLGDWPTPWRAVGAYSACFFLTAAAHVGGAWGAAQLGADWPIWLASAVSLVCLLGAVAMILPASVSQSLGIVIVHAALSIALLLPAAWAFKEYVFDSYAMPFATMAPSLRGHHHLHRCENCGLTFPVAFSESSEARDRLLAVCSNCGAEGPLDETSPLFGGDRFAVDRSGNPERWKLSAFESPTEPGMMFVARVVCLPAEHVDILEGDVFINGRRWPRMPYDYLEMWIPIADSDFHAQEAQPQGHPWETAGESSAWKRAERGWTCEAKGNESELKMKGVVDDSYSYTPRGSRNERRATAPVADLRLDCEMESLAGDGRFALRWKGRGRSITAEFSAAKLDKSITTGPDITIRCGDFVIAPEGETLSLAIRDGRFAVLRQGAPIWDQEFLPANFGEAKQVVSARDAPPTLSLLAQDIAVSVRRIRVARDVYYAASEDEPDFPVPLRSSMSMQNGEYFVVGDNSRISNDSRLFGPVKRSAFAGRVRATYWPPDRWRDWE